MIMSHGYYVEAVDFPFIVKISDRVPHLEYFAICGSQFDHWKRVGKEWVICDEEEFLSFNP
jgi:hypothetical protein